MRQKIIDGKVSISKYLYLINFFTIRIKSDYFLPKANTLLSFFTNTPFKQNTMVVNILLSLLRKNLLEKNHNYTI